MNALPKSAQPAARKALAEIQDAEDKEHATRAIHAFSEAFAVKYPKVVARIVDDAEELLTFYDFPAAHWVHLKTTNPIESTFAGPATHQGDQGTGQPGSRPGDGLQAHRVRPDPLAGGQRTASGGSRSGRSQVEKGVMIEASKSQDQEVAA